MATTPPIGPDSSVRVNWPREQDILRTVRLQHLKYMKLARFNSVLYYATRLVAAICSSLLPFFVKTHPDYATGLAIAVVASVSIDSVVRPREQYELYSKATDLMSVAEAKLSGQYEGFREIIHLMMATEGMKLNRLRSLKDVLDDVARTS